MSVGVRRHPVQRRSVQRVNQILDAAAALLDEGGYDALGTRAVAARAGVPVGSIYRYFPDKRGLADALTRRNLEEFLDRVRRGRPEVADWPAVCDLLVDTYVEMKRSTPGFAVLDFSDNARVTEALVVEVVGAFVTERVDLSPDLAAALTDADLRRTLLVAVEAADALIKLAFRTDPRGDPGLIGETKHLLRDYLEGTAGRFSPGR